MKMNIMMDISSYQNEATLKKFLANQLLNGRLALILGAGASFGFGLPGWDELVVGAFKSVNKKKPARLNNEQAADYLLNKICSGDDIRFAKLIKKVLYKKFNIKFDELRQNPLLSSLGALTMVSRRGSVSRVISYNFDDILELYLTYFGYDVESVGVIPTWSSRADVRVYHPHGFLPTSGKDDIKSGIVFAQTHYDRIVGRDADAWRQIQIDFLRSNTCLFIGLSGNDSNLTSILEEVKGTHISQGEHIHWGVRFSDDADDPLNNMWESKNVYPKILNSYNELPPLLFEICQIASKKLN